MMDAVVQPPESQRCSWRERRKASPIHCSPQSPTYGPWVRRPSPVISEPNLCSKPRVPPASPVIAGGPDDTGTTTNGQLDFSKAPCCADEQQFPPSATFPEDESTPDTCAGNTNLLPGTMSMKTKLQHLRCICKDMTRNILFIILYLMGLYVYTMAGGAILVSLDNEYLQTLAAQRIEDIADQEFTPIQLEFLTNYSIPPPPIVLSIFDGQQYALQLSVTIGYGNITSRSAPARWFAVFYSMIGILFVGYSVLKLGPHMFRIYVRIAVLFLILFCPDQLTYRKDKNSMQKYQLGVQSSSHSRNPLTLWRVQQLMACISPSPCWDKVCILVMKAADGETNIICPSKMDQLLKEYAKDVLEEEQMGWNSWVGLKFTLLLVWMLLGAAVYSTQCTCMTTDFGTALYFIFITLTTIGTGDYSPCGVACEQFWFFHTVGGLGMMAVVIQIAACKLLKTFRVSSIQSMDLTEDYGLNCSGRSSKRFPVLVETCKAVAMILAYCMVGGAIFYAYETAVPRPPAGLPDDFKQQGFTAAQLQFLEENYAPAKPAWTYLGGVNYISECVTTLGYGDYSPTTSGGRTFAVFFILGGLGLVGLKLEYLAETIRKVLHFCCGTIAHCLDRPIFAMEHDEKLLHSLRMVFDYVSKVLEGESQTALPDWEFPSELQCATPGVHRTLSVLPVDVEAPRLETALALASLPLARLYHTTTMRCAVRELIGALLLMVLLVGVSVPVLMAAEGWTAGDAAWFAYISSTTIGLGDIVPMTTVGVWWWHFMVLATIGHLSVFLPSVLAVHRGLVAKKNLSSHDNEA